MPTDGPYNPLEKANLGESVADALLHSSVRPLADTSQLIGAGVYAIYFTGNFELYRPIQELNKEKRFDQPIYVGKAVPKGARKGGLNFDSGKGNALRDRLKQHATSIQQTINLNLTDFYYRALTIDDIWIPLGENVLIDKFQPLWNRVIDGFGNKDPGKRRILQYSSSWDALHPGREFAGKLASNPLSTDEIKKKVDAFFAGKLPDAEKLSIGEDAED